jgi:hypothetical protein
VTVDPSGSEGSAEEALTIAEALDDVELRSFAYDALATVAMAKGDYAGTYTWSTRRIELVPQLTDPDHISLVYNETIGAVLSAGKLDEARQMAQTYHDMTRRLSSHHRLHAAYWLIAVEALAGRWDVVSDLAGGAESAVAANAETPCALEDVALLYCALAHVLRGAEEQAKRLEEVVASLEREGFDYFRRSIEAEIALARGDLQRVERMLEEWTPEGFIDMDGLIARLDGLVALERRADIEAEAPPLLIEGSYLEPFALRALGWARRDPEMLSRAIDRFDAMGMTWFAAQTKGWS